MTELQNMLWLIGCLAVSFGPAIVFMIVSKPPRAASGLQASEGDQAFAGSVVDAGLSSTAGCDMHHSC